MHPLKRIWYAYFIPATITGRNYILNVYAHKNTYTFSFFSAFMIQNLGNWDATQEHTAGHTDVVHKLKACPVQTQVSDSRWSWKTEVSFYNVVR
jgi:hypothetical protein